MCASVTKQYNLVPANGRWCLAAVKVTVGLALHCPGVTDISVPPPMGSRPRRGRWAPAYALLCSMVNFTFTYVAIHSYGHCVWPTVRKIRILMSSCEGLDMCAVGLFWCKEQFWLDPISDITIDPCECQQKWFHVLSVKVQHLKDHRQRIPRFVIRRYLE